MAAQYVVPQLRIFQEFEAVTAGATASLGACMIGPYYKVRDKVSFGEYTPEGKEGIYPGIDSTDNIDESVLDAFKGYIKDALIAKETLTITGDVEVAGNVLATDILLADSSVAEVPKGYTAFQVGDIARFVYSNGDEEDHTITGFSSNESIKQTYRAEAPRSNALVVDLASSTLTRPIYYTGRITTSFKAGTDDAGFYVQDNTGRTVYSQTADVATYEDIDIGSGIKFSFNAADVWWEGDEFTIAIVPAMDTAVGAYNAAFLSDTPTANPDTVKLIKVEQIGLTTGTDITFTEAGYSVPASLKYKTKDVLGGELQVTFKTLSTQYSDNVYACTSIVEARELLGDLTDENPLGLMVAQALSNSNGRAVYFVGVTDTAEDGYMDALANLEDDSRVYSIVPATTNLDTLTKIESYIDYLSGPEVMNWSIGWFACDLTEDVVVASGLTGISTGTAVLDLGSSANVQGLRSGDVVEVPGAGNFRIIAVDDIGGKVTVYKDLPTGTFTDLRIVRTTSATDKAQEAIDAASRFNNYRVRMVVTPGIATQSSDYRRISNVYMAAACAGYRSGVAPHQPLTRAEVNGFIIPSMNLSVEQLNRMAKAGIWLVVRDNAGTVYVRHQLTTDTVNYTTREDSKITNGDEICRYVRAQLEPFYGRANVSEEFINVLYLTMISVPDKIRSRPYSDLIGPQISSAEYPDISQDPDLPDKVIIRVRYFTPNPANYIDLFLAIQ